MSFIEAVKKSPIGGKSSYRKNDSREVKGLMAFQVNIPTERKINLSKSRPTSVNERHEEMNDKLLEKMLENDQFKKQNFNNPASILTQFSGDATK